MRALLLVLTMSISTTAFASGKLSVEPRYNPKNEQTTYTVGLGVYETLIRNRVALNSWTGFGDSIDDGLDADYSKWFVTKNSVDLFLTEMVAISPGIRIAYRPRDGEFSEDTVVQEIFGKLTIKLW